MGDRSAPRPSAQTSQVVPDDRNDGWIGTDEAGKGDYFGPLVAAAVYVHTGTEGELRRAGVRDSKALSDTRARALSVIVRQLCPVHVVSIGPERYNSLYAKMRNLNRLLAWAHARAIESLLATVNCERVISDQFADARVLESALMTKGRTVHLLQRPRAEADRAVAAASIVARAEFLERLQILSASVDIDLAKGAGEPVLRAGRQFVGRYGGGALNKVAKVHFRTTQQLVSGT